MAESDLGTNVADRVTGQSVDVELLGGRGLQEMKKNHLVGRVVGGSESCAGALNGRKLSLVSARSSTCSPKASPGRLKIRLGNWIQIGQSTNVCG